MTPRPHPFEYAAPGRITMALNAKALDGPDVDEACGVAEPTVDLWEAGVLLPDREQVRRLAELTGQVPEFFYEAEQVPAGRVFICSRRKEFRQVVEPGQVACPACPGCGRVMWAVMPAVSGPVLIERPDLAYGQMVAAVIERVRQGRRKRIRWGVRPVEAGERPPPHLRRRPHVCPAGAVVVADGKVRAG